MQNIVLNDRAPLPESLRYLLPPRLSEEIERIVPAGCLAEEIRLRRERCASLVLNAEHLRLRTVLSGAEMDALLPRLCGGSLYAHGETVCKGYIALGEGIRVGVCGRANLVHGEVIGVSEISSFVIRLPHPHPPLLGGEICALLKSAPFWGILLYAPPAEGKTTLLRAIAAQMAGGPDPKRVAVVDTRGELDTPPVLPQLTLDILSGYPRGQGISIAARTLSPQLIVCDEIGDLAEAREILAAHIGGVPLLASAHASNLRELLARPGIRLLHEAGCFAAYVRLRRRPGAFDFDYEITPREAANAAV